MTAFKGIITIMIPIPASTDGPRVCHKKNKATLIWKGPDQIMCKYVVRSINLWASTDIKFTISPTVDCFLAEFESLRV